MATMQMQKQETPTQQQSLTLMRNLLRTSISSIAYLRGLFPEDSFKDRNLAGIGIKSLVPSSPNSQLLVKWLEDGVFDALEKKYLRELVFGIGTSKDELQESYNFLITYSENGPSVQISHTSNQSKKMHGPSPGSSKEDIKRSTVLLLRNLVALSQTLNPIADTHVLTMKLFYYDDVTPPDYEPKFFRPALDDLPSFREQPVKLKVGHVLTPFHSLALKVKTTVDVMEDAPDLHPPAAATNSMPLSHASAKRNVVAAPAPPPPPLPPPSRREQTPPLAPASPDVDLGDSPLGLPRTNEEEREEGGGEGVRGAKRKEAEGGEKSSEKTKTKENETLKETTSAKRRLEIEEVYSAKEKTKEKGKEVQMKEKEKTEREEVYMDANDGGDNHTQELDETELSGIIQGLVKKHQSANLPLLMRECPGVTETALKKILSSLEKEGQLRTTEKGYEFITKQAKAAIEDPKAEAQRLIAQTAEWVLHATTVNGPALSKALNVDLRLAKGLLARLEKEQVLGPHVNSKGRTVDKAKAAALSAKLSRFQSPSSPPRPTPSPPPPRPPVFHTPNTPEELAQQLSSAVITRPSPSLSKLPRTVSRRVFPPSPAQHTPNAAAAAAPMPPPAAVSSHPFPVTYNAQDLRRAKTKLGPMLDSQQESQQVTGRNKVSVVSEPLNGKRRRVIDDD